MEYGLIGEKLGHSFSVPIHEGFGFYGYGLLPLDQNSFENFFNKKQFKAVNVTIPYKEQVMKYCAYVQPLAKEIGAVNTVVNKSGILEGYNTDLEGLTHSINKHGIELSGRTVLILGSGGAAKTALAAVKKLGAAKAFMVSRKPAGQNSIDYESATKLTNTSILINATPVGMFPNNNESPFNLACLPKLAAVFDLIYNPLKTRLLLQAEELGIIYENGLDMLVWQAAAACGHFIGKRPEDEQCRQIYKQLIKNTENIVLCGMPSSGKSSIGKLCATMLNRPFYDIDKEIEKKDGRTIPQIFSENGEDFFRNLESSICAEISKNTGCVISTGGGIVKNSNNMAALRQNGKIIFIDRPLDLLTCGTNRPLSKTAADIENLFEERLPLYEKYADIRIENNGSFTHALDKLMEAIK